MTILFIIPDYGSFNNFLSELAASILDKKSKVVLIASPAKVINIEDREDFSESENFKFYPLAFPRKYELNSYISVSKKIQEIVKHECPDIIHAHFTAAIIALAFAKRKYFPLSICTFHGMNATITNGILRIVMSFVELTSIARLDRSYVLNKEDYAFVNKIFPKKIELLPVKGLGCDLQRFNPFKFDQSSIKKLRDSLGINTGDFVMIYIGRTVFFKGYNIIGRAFLEMVSLFPKLKLIVIGDRDPIHKTGLNDEEERLLSVNTNFLHLGFKSEVENYLAISNLMVFPSQKEGIPLCITEALAMGVPVITSNSRGCNELIRNGHNGFVTNSYTDLKSKIQLFLEKPETELELKRNILSEREALSREKFVAYQLQTYKSLLEIAEGE
mgnify:CR=1 FL=1